ncbi:heat shock 70 kDa protein 15-like [Lycium barbarum]|uniref:heat shock 70 kDa protein 15-like n=1 Tax=Lycium barbarum TaxID=112863 RepID=UPI00293F4F4C|nr:heat shock 70 kDa protein 15-like [Lycium barbarum]
METDEASATPSTTSETDVNMQDGAAASGANNGVPESGDKPVQMETDAKVEAPKKKVKKTFVPVTKIVYGAMAAADVQKAVEKGFEMALQDHVMEETKDKKNVVESYVYDMRNKVFGSCIFIVQLQLFQPLLWISTLQVNTS